MTFFGHTLGWIVLAMGWVLSFLGSLWIIVVAWQRSVLWGFGCFVLPALQLVYVGLHWKETKEGFFLLLAGFVLVIVGHALGVGS